jgi:hypothetical protein
MHVRPFEDSLIPGVNPVEVRTTPKIASKLEA